MPRYILEPPPLATAAELRALYAALPPDRARAMTEAFDVLADLEAHQHRFTTRVVKKTLSEHGFIHAFTAPNDAEYWAPKDPPATYDKGAVVVPDPDGGFGDTAARIDDVLWALAQSAGTGMVEATARVLAVAAADNAALADED